MSDGIIFDIREFTLHDGPGIRTTVFLKGCPLACVWCHNPESQGRSPVLAFDAQRCTQCGLCAAACPHGCHNLTPATASSPASHTVDRTACVACGRCVAACLSSALEI